MAKKAKEPLHVRDFENMDEDQILAQVLVDQRTSAAFQEPYFTKFRKYYQLYRSYLEEKDKKVDRSNLFIPRSFELVETVTPKLVNAIFASRPYVQTIPLGVTDNAIREHRAKKMNKLLDFQFQQKIKLLPICTDVLKTTHIYGTAITRQQWDFKVRKVVKRRPDASMPGAYNDVLVESVVKDDPAVVLVPLLDFFFDPAGTTIEEGRYNIHRYWEDYHELVEKNKNSEGAYKNLDKLKVEQDAISTAANGANQMLTSIGLGTNQNSNKGVEIWEYWTDEWVVKVANQKYVIFSSMNPYFHMKKPFAKWIDVPVPNEFYGIGEIEAVEPLQNELNTTRNQRVDNVSFVLNKMWKIKRGANVDTMQLISRPAGFIEVDEKDDVEEIKFQDVTASAYQEESVIKQDMDRTTGVHDTERGSSPSRRETATTMNILANAGSERFKLKTLLTEYGGFHDMVNQIVWLNQQYIDRPKEILILGDDNVVDNDTIYPEEVLGSWSIVAVGSSIEPVINKDARQASLVQLYSLVQNRQDVNHQEILKTIFEAFDFRNIDKLLTPPTPQPMQQQMPQQPAMGGGTIG